MLDVDIGFFKRAPFFADFDAEQLRLLAFSADVVDLEDGDLLFREGETSDGGYLVVHGQIDLLQQGPTGQALVESVEEGTLIGETALLTETIRPVTAVAAGPSRVYRITRRLFHKVLREYPSIADRLAARITARIAALAPDLTAVADRLVEGLEPEAEDGPAPAQAIEEPGVSEVAPEVTPEPEAGPRAP